MRESSTFNLIRHFSIASFITMVIAMLLATVVLGAFYRRLGLNDLTEMGERQNVALTQAFANSLWPRFSAFLTSVAHLSNDELRAHADTAKLHNAVLAQMHGLSVLKVKIYDLTGRTVFSTEARQIGENKSNNGGFLSARSGKVASELTHRDTFSAFEGVIENRDLISSYIPIQRGGPGSPVEAVFELYHDVTPLLWKIQRTQKVLTLGVIVVLGCLYCVLFFIVRRADRIVKLQEMERIGAEKALAEKAVELARSNQELEQFAYVASHDLQEPLRMITGYTQLLAKRYRGKLDQNADDYIGFAVEGAKRMEGLVKSLLNYSRVDTKRKDFSPADCEAVLENTLTVLQATIKDSGAIVTHGPLPTVVGDERQLGQLFQNLIANGIKFRNSDAPEIHVSCKQEGQNWLFSVRDNGIGIDPQYANKIFVIFQRLHTREEYPGTGIGLAVCKKIAERHGGRIWVESQPGKGATFYFTVPTMASEGSRTDV